MQLLDRIKLNYHNYGYRGLFLSAKSRVLPPQSVTRVKPPEFNTPVLLRTRSSDVGTYRQIFINQEYKIDLANTPKIIIDAGANVGYSALYFSNKYPSARIFAVEPESSNFELLKRNVSSTANIFPIKAALWGHNTKIELSDPGVGKWGFRTLDRNSGQHGSFVETVPGITLEKLFMDYGIDHVDILKIDIEGAEKEVFSHNISWIDRIDILMIELHERFCPGSSDAVLNATMDFQYECYRGENLFLARNSSILTNPQGKEWRRRF